MIKNAGNYVAKNNKQIKDGYSFKKYHNVIVGIIKRKDKIVTVFPKFKDEDKY